MKIEKLKTTLNWTDTQTGISTSWAPDGAIKELYWWRKISKLLTVVLLVADDVYQEQYQTKQNILSDQWQIFSSGLSGEVSVLATPASRSISGAKREHPRHRHRWDYFLSQYFFQCFIFLLSIFPVINFISLFCRKLQPSWQYCHW